MTSQQLISSDDIQTWLKAIQQYQPAPIEICQKIPPLKTQLEKLATHESITYTATLWITEVIKAQYQHIRISHDLPALSSSPNRKDTAHQITQDFLQNNKFLEAWSLLYHVYVTVELTFTDAELEVLTLQSARNLRRRKSLGYTLVCHTIHRIHETLTTQ